jgi:hypothetical protein
MARSLKAAFAALTLAGALTAAGCGGSSGANASSATTSTGSSSTQAGAAFRDCLAKHGLKLPAGFGRNAPRPGSGQPPQGQPPQGARRFNPGGKEAKAFAACRSKLPAGARAFTGGTGRQGNPAFAKYTSCLRKHGVTFGGSNNQAVFKKASAACAKYAPKPGG